METFYQLLSQSRVRQTPTYAALDMTLALYETTTIGGHPAARTIQLHARTSIALKQKQVLLPEDSAQ